MEINLLLKLRAKPDSTDPGKPNQFATTEQALSGVLKELGTWWHIDSVTAAPATGPSHETEKRAFDMGFEAGVTARLLGMIPGEPGSELARNHAPSMDPGLELEPANA